MAKGAHASSSTDSATLGTCDEDEDSDRESAMDFVSGCAFDLAHDPLSMLADFAASVPCDEGNSVDSWNMGAIPSANTIPKERKVFRIISDSGIEWSFCSWGNHEQVIHRTHDSHNFANNF